MRAPPKRPTTQARIDASVSTYRHNDGRRSVRVMDETREIMLNAGPAKVGVTHGKKVWGSDRLGGITMESTCHVEVSCEQDPQSLAEANAYVHKQAYEFMELNFQRVQKELEEFFTDKPE